MTPVFSTFCRLTHPSHFHHLKFHVTTITNLIEAAKGNIAKMSLFGVYF